MTKFIVRKIILVLMIAVIYSCNLEKENKSTASKTQTLFTLLDAKETGIDFFNKVKNQKNCGACWAFSIVETIESMYAIATGKLKDLSIQQVQIQIITLNCVAFN